MSVAFVSNRLVTVIGGKPKSDTEFAVSIKLENVLITPTMHFMGRLENAEPEMLELGSIGAAALNCKLDFARDVFMRNPRDIRILSDVVSGESPDVLASVTLIAFIRSIRKIIIRINSGGFSEPEFVECKIRLNDSAYGPLKLVDENDDQRESLGKFFTGH